MRMLVFSLPLALSLGCREPVEEVPPENGTPVANAGSNLTQDADAPVTLDGSGSYDPDGDPISFHWEFTSVPEGSSLGEAEDPFPANHTTTPSTSFRPDKSGSYVVALTVVDNQEATSMPDYVVVTVEVGSTPVANAGPDLEGTEGESFSLDGSGSYDPYGRDLTYSWSFASVPDQSSVSTLTGGDAASASFVADAGGVYIASLVVHNGIVSSHADTTIVRVSSANPEPPVAVGGDDQEVSDCSWLTLDGSGSYDPNNDDMTYQWTLQSKPAGSAASSSSFNDIAAPSTEFWPDVAGDYVVSLAVFDGLAWSSPDLVNITASERLYNTPPTVDPGAVQSFDGGEVECEESGYTYDCEECGSVSMTLGQGGSITDPDNDPYTLVWEVSSGDASITTPTSLETSALLSSALPTEPGECETNEYQFLLTVTDCTGASTTSTVVHQVSCCGVEKARRRSR